MLDVQQLTVLVGVARTGSYTGAARLLGYTQPAVSYRMRSLERTMGVPLAVRDGRGIRLTPAGRRLAEHAEKVLAALRAVESEFGAYADHARGRVRTSAIRSVCDAVLPGAVAKFQSAEPGVEVVLDQASSADAYRLLRLGETDLALLGESEEPGGGPDPAAGTEADPGSGAASGPGPVPDPGHGPGHGHDPGPGDEGPEAADSAGLLRVPLLRDRPCVLLPVHHPLSSRGSLALGDLSAEDWILPSGRERFLAACAEREFAPRVVVTTDDQATTYGMVADGVGVALAHGLGLPRREDAPVLARPLDQWPGRRVSAVLRPESMAVRTVAALVTAVRLEAGDQLSAAAARREKRVGEYAGTRSPEILIGPAEPECPEDRAHHSDVGF